MCKKLKKHVKGVITPPLTFEGHYTPLYSQPNTFSAYCIRSYSLIYSLPITDSFSLYPQIHRTKHSSFSKYGPPHPASPHPGYTIPLPKSNQTHPICHCFKRRGYVVFNTTFMDAYLFVNSFLEQSLTF